jgi:antibiotic biosynthesis monooxygenase (ABM) superfamily enzyme
MYIHAFVFRWKDGVSEKQKAEAVAEIKALAGKIPGLLETYVGRNISRHADVYQHGGVMKFEDRESLDQYATHPAHVALLNWLVPLIDPIELDFAIEP